MGYSIRKILRYLNLVPEVQEWKRVPLKNLGLSLEDEVLTGDFENNPAKQILDAALNAYEPELIRRYEGDALVSARDRSDCLLLLVPGKLDLLYEIPNIKAKYPDATNFARSYIGDREKDPRLVHWYTPFVTDEIQEPPEDI